MSAEQEERTKAATSDAQVCPEAQVPVPKKLTPEEAEVIRNQAQEIFDYFDLDKNGYVEASEVENVFRKWNDVENNYILFSEEEIKELGAEFMRQGDANADAKVTLDEIYNALLKESGYEV